MSQRKQYVIDKKFQFRTTFSIIGFVTIITAFIIAAIAVTIVSNNAKIDNIHKIEDRILEFVFNPGITKSLTAKKYEQAKLLVVRNHLNNRKNLKTIIKHNQILLIILILTVLIQGIILYILLIRKTHKISGPIFVMSNYMNEIIKGKTPQFRKLREKDELKDFYELFQKMVQTKFK